VSIFYELKACQKYDGETDMTDITAKRWLDNCKWGN